MAHCAGEVVQRMLQPGDGIGVKVLVGFTSNNMSGADQQQAAKRDAALFTTDRNVRLLASTARRRSASAATSQLAVPGCDRSAGLKESPRAMGLFSGQAQSKSASRPAWQHKTSLRVRRFALAYFAIRASFNDVADGLARVKFRALAADTHLMPGTLGRAFAFDLAGSSTLA